MVINKLVVFVILILSVLAEACPYPDVHNYSIKEIQKAEYENKLNSEQYRWLYDELIEEKLRQENPYETFKSFRVHLLDSLKSFPKPVELSQKNLKDFNNPVLIEGTIKYVEIFPKKYRMNVLRHKSKLNIVVNVHFKNATEADLQKLKLDFVNAENIWNQKLFKTDIPFLFQFKIVQSEEEAHFSVKLLDDTRGPYDMYWSRSWPSNVVAHEIGHMLGLGDEYQTLTGKFDCHVPFLMCGAWYGQLQPMHQYFVLRRLIQP